MVGESRAIRRVRSLIQAAASSLAPVIITGESGTGKERVAREIHESSSRCSGPFVALNCAAIPDTLAESALFGYERGAFTGASGRNPGAFGDADGGTILLDEFTDLAPAMQPKLLRVLEDKSFRRLGGREGSVDVRTLAATNQSPEEAVRERRFRADLYYRLNVLRIDLPAFETGGEFESPPKKLSNGWSAAFGREHYAPIWSVNLLVRRPKAFPGGDHWLTFILAQKREMRISFGGHVPPAPDKPVEGLLVPMYFRSPDWCGFLSRAKAVQQVSARDRLGRSMVTHQQAERVRRGSYGESMTICLKLDLAAWPGDIARYEDLIKESLEVFLAYIEAGASVLGQ